MSDKKKPAPPPETGVALREDRPHFITPAQGTSLTSCPTTIDLSTEWGKAQMLACVGVPDLVVDPAKPIEVDVTGFLVYPDSRIDEETGEESQFVRTVLICSDGKTFGTTSPVVLSRLKALLQLWPDAPWNPPLRISIIARMGRRTGRLYHDLRVIPTEDRR